MATTQKQIKGWKVTLMKVKDDIKFDHLSMVSAAMAYYALFAIVPALTSIVLIYAWVSNPEEIAGHVARAKEILPEEILNTVSSILQGLASKAHSGLGLSAILSICISLFAASKGAKAAIEAMNIIYERVEQRNFIRLNGLAIGMTFLGVVLAIVAMGVIVGIPAVTSLIKLPPQLGIIATIGSWVALLAIFSFFLTFLYRFGPDRERTKWKWFSTGAVIASVLFSIVSALFSWYAKEFGNFDKTYGSLGAIIVVMTWFYLSSFVILLGAEINSELEQKEKAPNEVISSAARTLIVRDRHPGLSRLKQFFSRGRQHRV